MRGQPILRGMLKKLIFVILSFLKSTNPTASCGLLFLLKSTDPTANCGLQYYIQLRANAIRPYANLKLVRLLLIITFFTLPVGRGQFYDCSPPSYRILRPPENQLFNLSTHELEADFNFITFLAPVSCRPGNWPGSA